MTTRFQAGRTVEFLRTLSHRTLGSFEVVRELPWEGGEFKYRLRSTADGHERIAAQHELRASATTAARTFQAKTKGA